MKTLILDFSPRPDGNCAAISKYIVKSFCDASVIKITDLDIKSCTDCDYQCFSDKCPHPDDLFKLYDSILESDLIYFLIPNYCDYPPSSFFVFNERSCAYFNNKNESLAEYLRTKKKFIVISNSNEENFVKVLQQQSSDDIQKNIIFLSSKKFGLKSIEGNLLSSNEAKTLIDRFIEEK